ncbi:MAG: hypothetical protein J7L96_00615 [Bacteroidales bacterium]|nr:hypothetical protein [Bacteroidales bacterium]
MKLATEKYDLESKLMELESELNKAQLKNSIFPNYLAGLSHDIRTPLNAIVGFAGLLTEPDLDPEQLRFYSDMITRSSRKLLRMISNLIDLAKMETGNLKLFIERVSVSDLMEELRNEMLEERRIFDKSDITLTFQGLHNGSGFLNTDRSRLYQILKILLDNSLKFTKKGSISLEVSLQTDKKMVFILKDTGAGMDADTLNNLFNLFPMEIDSSRLMKIKSRGLGMLVVSRLTKILRSEIFITSEKNKGTTVSLVAPVV